MSQITAPLILIDLKEEGLHILLHLSMFGECQWAVLDTGASKSYFDLSVSIYLDASVALTKRVVIPEIKIGALSIKDYKTQLINLNVINEAYTKFGSPRIIGIIGSDILYQYKAIIDYSNMEVVFTASDIMPESKP
jgi:hypothetical protein